MNATDLSRRLKQLRRAVIMLQTEVRSEPLVWYPRSSLTISAPLSPSCRVGTFRRSTRYAVHVPPPKDRDEDAFMKAK